MIPSVDLTLRVGGIAPSVLRELSGIYPTFASAFKELISNSYDADATIVDIAISPDLGTITVQDNGVGMTPFELQSHYLRIGGSSQRQKEGLTPGGRQPIGRKGIGFLAVARYCKAVEICSYAAREIVCSATVTMATRARSGADQPVAFFQGPFATQLAQCARVTALHSGSIALKPSDYAQSGSLLYLRPETWQGLPEQAELSVEYLVDCSGIDVTAYIDYGYLLDLADNHNLETVKDFCRVRLNSHDSESTESYTRITLHLRDFVTRDLKSSLRRGRVRNLASASGLDRFLWHLSRSLPVAYDPPMQEQSDLSALNGAIPPTPFSVRVRDNETERELRRPFIGDVLAGDSSQTLLVREPIQLRLDGLEAQGYIFGFSHPVFPAELRGIAVRLRGVEVGRPGFFGMENDIPVKYRAFLSQVMGEVIVTQGLDAGVSLLPGREGFYADNPHYLALRRCLVGDGSIMLGALGAVLDQLSGLRSVDSSVARIVQDAKRRKTVFVDISQALTELSVAPRYGRVVRGLFNNSNVAANGLSHAPEYDDALPGTIGSYSLEVADLIDKDYVLDGENRTILLSQLAVDWKSGVYILGRHFVISLRNGGHDGPLCEVDFATNTIYLNWAHPIRGKMGDGSFAKSAVFWRIAYLAAEGDVDLMMNLAHRLLSLSA